ncbi:MAG: hypothetical protein OXF79_26040 [Chloroflexi bacterium]|nr:hypothetical protein [Chloroflexota bacterium]
MTYARNTTVSAMRTRNEIEETLERYGADGFAYATQGNLATVIFAMENRRIPWSWSNAPTRGLPPTPTTARTGNAATGPSGSLPTRRARPALAARCAGWYIQRPS